MSLNRKEVTQTDIVTRIRHAGLFALASSVVIGVTQVLLGQKGEQIVISAGTEFCQGCVTSFMNQTIYNRLKKILASNPDIDNTSIEYISAVLVSIFGVGAPKLLFHNYVNTAGAGYIATSYTLLNIIVMILYEKKILQKGESGS